MQEYSSVLMPNAKGRLESLRFNDALSIELQSKRNYANRSGDRVVDEVNPREFEEDRIWIAAKKFLILLLSEQEKGKDGSKNSKDWVALNYEDESQYFLCEDETKCCRFGTRRWFCE